ncbi:N-formylglutamate amidohydrolase [Roseobacter ponti]|uniref:N-formylglutamate amidohydrolase n=1 Tax=Roseobacter ponti TaxID=1891787 RepID=A0A858SUE1_9RHOB|nr:N-formylglutamate amidohydrolase [Roseobacter ponti]QJF51131.1 N-formylglutamate amidohydrolase [Roseobacter ponti]
MNHSERRPDEAVVEVHNAQATSPVVIVCEHASAHIPAVFDDLGLSGDALHSHVAWDPGALAVARHMSQELDAVLVASRISRLVYDCNRPPDAAGAMPVRSEIVDVPGNRDLSKAQKADRVAKYYEPFRAALSNVLARVSDPVLVTIHSFTPVYHGRKREVEIGVLHDKDARLADALLSDAVSTHAVRRNEPYGPGDGVTHTLKEHALGPGLLNVMLEVRNDLIAGETDQAAMADLLSGWIRRALTPAGAATC